MHQPSYRPDAWDQSILDARVAQFADQTRRYLAGELGEDEFKPLRLQNGLYIERHAPMLRIAIPYGVIASTQLRALADVARRFDKGVAHFTTRQNIQFNHVRLEEVPAILGVLSKVGLHAIQTSGSCIRNVTTDHLAGVAADEHVDPRPYAELLRQWSTLHPEFVALPRKFKVALHGAAVDRAATAVHDLAFELWRDVAGEVRVRVKVGGGQGRTPRLASVIREDLHWRELLTYSEAVLRAYNRWGRRDNIYKARIKILVDALGPERFAAEVEQEWAHLRDGPSTLGQADLDRVARHFHDPDWSAAGADVGPEADVAAARLAHPRFNGWLKRNVHDHRAPGRAAATISLKPQGVAPGDVTADQLDLVADLADRHSFGEARVSHLQNLILPHVARVELFALWRALEAARLGEPNAGLATDVICCPGGDYCSLANAKSIPVAAAIQSALSDKAEAIGDLAIKISGCINACGHHHVGHIGVLGVDKKDEEWFQILIGGRADGQDRLARIIGKSIPRAAVAPVVSRLADHYLSARLDGEQFIDTVERLGRDAFQAAAFTDLETAA
jgi:sulfite reductase (NADPH) hemoprotein beta-component